MNRITSLIHAYETQVKLKWDLGLHGAERTWFAVYDPNDERRLRAALGEFELATLRNGHKWHLVDVTNSFETWLAESEYREAFFEDPEFLEMKYGDFESWLQDRLKIEAESLDDDTVLGISGVGTLYGFARVSGIVGGISESVKGRLLVLFPGAVNGNTYQLFNARDGWNYRAIAITASG